MEGNERRTVSAPCGGQNEGLYLSPPTSQQLRTAMGHHGVVSISLSEKLGNEVGLYNKVKQ